MEYRNLLLFAYLQLRNQKEDKDAQQDQAGGRNRLLMTEVAKNLPGMVKTDDKKKPLMDQ